MKLMQHLVQGGFALGLQVLHPCFSGLCLDCILAGTFPAALIWTHSAHPQKPGVKSFLSQDARGILRIALYGFKENHLHLSLGNWAGILCSVNRPALFLGN